MARERVIMHVDMDAFFAAIEQRDNPELRGRPVVVGADPKEGKGRGVVATCSYEARAYGIHSAMPISQAWRRCPEAAYVRPRGDVYAQVSRQVRAVLEEFTPQIEPVSIDEAFLDVTGTPGLSRGKRALAEAIARRIEEVTRLTASLGVAPNKMIAKIASDMDKPRGIVIVEPDEAQSFLRPLPTAKLWGVGEKTREILERLGIRTVGDLADFDQAGLVRRLGKHGEHLWNLARGRDQRPVEPPGEAKSVGNEHTFETDTDDLQQVEGTLMCLCEKVAGRLRAAGLRGRTVTTKVRFEDFTTLTRAKTADDMLDEETQIYAVAVRNLRRADIEGRKVRLVGVSVSGFEEGGEHQTSLFDRPAPGEAGDDEKRRRLAEAIDYIKGRYGDDALRRGGSMQGKDTGDESDG